MHPVIFKIGPITLYSFGMMMALAFIVASYFFTKELRRHQLDEKISSSLTMIALIGGVGGCKIFSILENFSDFLRDPVHQFFSPAGLTFYGGFIVAGLWIYVYVKRKKLRFTLFADMIAPTVLLAYGIGRIGCQLAGDGDYGIPTRLPWGMTYPLGTAKPTGTLFEYFEKFPSERIAWHYDSLRTIITRVDELGQHVTRFDEVATVHPAPLYEALFCTIAFAIIWHYRTKIETQVGKVFAVTLVVLGFERLMVEFVRINPLYLGLSMAQWISVGLIVGGGYALGVYYPRQKQKILHGEAHV